MHALTYKPADGQWWLRATQRDDEHLWELSLKDSPGDFRLHARASALKSNGTGLVNIAPLECSDELTVPSVQNYGKLEKSFEYAASTFLYIGALLARANAVELRMDDDKLYGPRLETAVAATGLVDADARLPFIFDALRTLQLLRPRFPTDFINFSQQLASRPPRGNP
jgi:hypothetical protein